MLLPDYISVEEVKRICYGLRIRDWTELKEPVVTTEEAEIILGVLDANDMNINVDDFKKGLEVELEHGTRYAEANVTNNHPILTGKIVIAHLKETLDYYYRLEVAELEGDILKALVHGNHDKVARLQKELIKAKLELHQIEARQL